jgi:hypothetical protein
LSGANLGWFLGLGGTVAHICHPSANVGLFGWQYDYVSNIEQTLTSTLGSFADVALCVGGLQAD